jgi:hypothetical protein
MSDQIDVLECGRVEPASEPPCQLVRRKPDSEPRQIEQVNAVTLRERLEHRLPPAPGAGKPVHEDNRFTLAGYSIRDRRSLDRELIDLHDDSFWQPRTSP